MEDGFGEHLMGVIPGVCKAWAVGMILCNPWFALALCSNRVLWWFVPAQVFFNKFPANHQRGEMELWGWVSGWACTSRWAPLEAGSWGCYLGREMEMSPAPRCLGGEIPFQGSSFWQQGAFNDHVDLPGKIEEECVCSGCWAYYLNKGSIVCIISVCLAKVRWALTFCFSLN